MEAATLDRTTSQDILDFIDEWLDDNGWKIDSTVIDFALDLRALVHGSTEE